MLPAEKTTVVVLLATVVAGTMAVSPPTSPSSLSPSLNLSSTNVTTRRNRLFSLISIVTFPNEVCNSSESGMAGVCYTSSECTAGNGRAAGTCAQGFGICCLFIETCSSMGSSSPPGRRVSYLQSVAYPTPQATAIMCLYTINRADPSICQIRLDFVDFMMDPGSTLTTPCDRDKVEVISSGLASTRSSPTGPLCGINTGQNMYLDLPLDQSTSPMIRITTVDRATTLNTTNYKYNIRITQIDCTSTNPNILALRAPRGCLQWFTARTGTVNSFSWSPSVQRVYNINQDYNICFRRDLGDCQMTLRRSATAPAFSTAVGLSGSATPTMAPFNFMPAMYLVPMKCGPENGCGNRACLLQAGMTAVFSGDSLQITALYKSVGAAGAATTATTPQYVREGFFCGVGLGRDGAMAMTPVTTTDGTDSGEGILVQGGTGPFVLRFFTDGVTTPSMAPATAGPAFAPNEIGFSIDYSFQGTCTSIQEVAEPAT